MKNVRITLIFFIVAAGCAGPKPIAVTSESASQTFPTFEAPTNNTLAVPNTHHLRLSDCHGIAADYVGLTEMYPGPKPPDARWENTWPINEIDLQIFECQRFSLDHFERGPIRLLIEYNGDFRSPAKCEENDQYDFKGMLTNLWVNDLNIVDHLVREYGAPARYGTINSTTTPDELTLEKWSWNLPGEAASTLEAKGVWYDDQATTSAYRLFWFNATSLHYMEYGFQGTGSNRVVASGTMRDPMLYPAKMDVEDYAGWDAEILTNYEALAPIKGFRDYGCEEPLW